MKIKLEKVEILNDVKIQNKETYSYTTLKVKQINYVNDKGEEKFDVYDIFCLQVKDLIDLKRGDKINIEAFLTGEDGIYNGKAFNKIRLKFTKGCNLQVLETKSKPEREKGEFIDELDYDNMQEKPF